MKCSDNCGYWWQDENESYPSCHYEGPNAWAPCAQEEFDAETIDD